MTAAGQAREPENSPSIYYQLERWRGAVDQKLEHLQTDLTTHRSDTQNRLQNIKEELLTTLTTGLNDMKLNLQEIKGETTSNDRWRFVVWGAVSTIMFLLPIILGLFYFFSKKPGGP